MSGEAVHPDGEISYGGNRPLSFGSKCVSDLLPITVKHEWTVKQFSVMQELNDNGSFLAGSIFGTPDKLYQFQLKLFPNGRDNDTREYISLFMQILECPRPKVQFRVNFSLISQEGPKTAVMHNTIVKINRSGIVTASKFFALEAIKRSASLLCPDDDLTIHAEVTIFDLELVSQVRSHLQFSNEASRDQSELPLTISPPVSSVLQQFLNSGEFSDFAVETSGGRVFRVHRVILAAHSGYFKGLFQTTAYKENAENKVLMADVDPSGFHTLLRYMYGICKEFSPADALEVVAIADRLCVTKLVSVCEESLSQSVNASNVVKCTHVAYSHNLFTLLNICTRFIAENRQMIQDSQEWCELRSSNPSITTFVSENAWKMADTMGIIPEVKKKFRHL